MSQSPRKLNTSPPTSNPNNSSSSSNTIICKPKLNTTSNSTANHPLRILVTGGGGFIGSHLIDYLMSMGHDVICLDSFVCGDKSNVSHWINHPKFELIRHDITQPIHLEVDQIYHLACPASPVHYQSNPIKTLKTNVLGTLNVCGIAKRTGARMLLASTSEVYGDPEVHPQVEEYVGAVNCVGPRSCYDEGKRAAEALSMDYFRQHKVDLRIARIFNTYGPRMLFNDGRVVSNFLVQSLQNVPISIYGDGSQTRSFCFVSDLVEGLVRLMNSEAFHGPINLGNNQEFTIKELAHLVQDLDTSKKTLFEYRSLPCDDPRRRQPDTTKALKYLNGWKPTVPLSQGLKLTYEEFKWRKEHRPELLKEITHQKGAKSEQPNRPANGSPVNNNKTSTLHSPGHTGDDYASKKQKM